MKKIISLILALALCLSLSAPVFAAEPETWEEPGIEATAEEDGGGTRWEETEWYYRIYGDLLQRRLWSITYGYWKTDWITIGHV